MLNHSRLLHHRHGMALEHRYIVIVLSLVLPKVQRHHHNQYLQFANFRHKAIFWKIIPRHKGNFLRLKILTSRRQVSLQPVCHFIITNTWSKEDNKSTLGHPEMKGSTVPKTFLTQTIFRWMNSHVSSHPKSKQKHFVVSSLYLFLPCSSRT